MEESRARADDTSDHARARLTAEHVAARALLDAATFEEAAPKILRAICDSLGWDHGALWRIDRDANVLRCSEVCTSSAVAFPEFNATSRSMTFAPGVGLPGRVWTTGEPVWIPDVVRDGNFPRARLAAREGLHAAFGFPVLLRGEVLGVMEFFSRDVREPDANLLSTLAAVGNQIGMFIDRRRAQEQLDRFFTLSLDMFCIAGFDGYFKRVNPAWTRWLGHTEQEMISKPYMDFVHPDDRDRTAAEANKLSEGHKVIYFENRYLHKDGTYRWLLWASAPFPEQQLIYATARDVTERKVAEETLARYARELETAHGALQDQAAHLARLVQELELAKARAEEATETKSAFLANMSHEVRTPLNAVLGMAALALQTRVNAEQKDYLTTIKSSGESLLAIVNDILDFSKIEARRLDLERTEFDLRETIGDAARLLAMRAAEKGIELACDVAADVPETLVGDPRRLRQVLLNVTGNAVKFTEKGEVVLRVSVTDATRDHVALEFSVSDTGIGIPSEKQGHIFQAFTQADNSTTRRYGGTGLGLAIAKHLVELMGGEISVQSDVGRGSTFHFTAVFEASEHAGPPAALPKRAALDGLRVLVVDDNATNRRILERMLESWHMEPTTVSDARSAIAALRDASRGRRFQAVITDCQMPDEDGFSLTRKIKHDPRLRTLPVIMLSSAAQGDVAAKRTRAGVDAYLMKPVKHSDLLDSLATLFGASTRRPARSGRARAHSKKADKPLRILVAEDNQVNRKLVTTLLKKRGHRVRAVENGREAVDAVRASGNGRFDVLIMDVQMPEIGGYEATRMIRAAEGPDRHLPIVALTAHAMQGDRERCLNAGMNAYLAKPIDVEALIATVEGFGKMPSTAGDHQPVVFRAAVFDESAALAHTGGDRRLLAELAEILRADARSSLRHIEQAIARGDAETIRIAAHTLKGSLATLGSSAGRDAAFAIEEAGRANDIEEAERAFSRLRDGVQRLEDALKTAGLLSKPRTRRLARGRRSAATRKRTRS